MRAFLASMEAELAEYKQKAQTVELMREQLLEYEARFERCRDQLRELTQYKFMGMVLRSRIAFLDPEAREMMLKPDHLGRPIFPA